MKNFFKKLRKEKNEKGSGIILVIVALSFLGIIAGALLTAVAYAYRLKLYDYNAKDNFHYVEQAMDEVYAGLGGRTTETMQDAYTRTIEEMVEFDVASRSYKNIGDEEANRRFKDYFMNGIKDDPAFLNITTLSTLIQSYISNSSVVVVSDSMRVIYYNEDGDVVMTVTPAGETGGDLGLTLSDDVKISKIVIQNLVLRRTANYQRSSANGTFTQTISTDVEISRPDFNVQFNTVSADNSVLYDYALIADSGIEINKSAASPLLINGNVYGGADFYNKNYNQYGVTDEDAKADYARPHSEMFGSLDIDITLDIVSSKTHTSEGTYLFNARLADKYYGNNDGVLTPAEYSTFQSAIAANRDLLYNGYNENSKYSGLYINGAKVSIMADSIVVPGSIAVMNGANLSVYNSNGTNIEKANVWADNVVLGGYNYLVPTGESTTKQVGSKATFLANMFVRDDLEINSDNSEFKLIGGYYGYGNGTLTNINESNTVKLTRKNSSYIPTVSTVDINPSESVVNNVDIHYYVDPTDGAAERDHYNSSSVVINGENSVLDLQEATTLYIAGQAYLELSAKHEDVLSQVSVNGGGEIVYASGSTDKKDVEKEVVTYDPTVQDYRTGESLSIKSNQLIYIPNGTGTYKDVEVNGKVAYQTIEINSMLLTTRPTSSTNSTPYNIFTAFFKDTTKVPCIAVVPAGSTRTYHYFDFDRIWAEDHKGYSSSEAMAAAFAQAYIDELNMSSSSASLNYSPIRDYLDQDVTNDTLFSAGEIVLPSDDAAVYASGALTGITKSITTAGEKKTHKIIVSKDAGITRPTTVEGDVANGNTDTTTDSVLLSMDFAKHYNYLKFSLVDLAAGSAEANFVDNVVRSATYGEAALSPLNRYFTMQNLFRVEPSTDVAADTTDHKLNLSSGYKVWITESDVEIKASDCELVDGKRVLRGIIVSKGDVIIGAGVDRFEGLIVAGDKIYVGNDITAISASPEICKTIMTELRTEKDPDAERVLRFFVGYKSKYDDMTKEELKTLCEQLGISVAGDSPTEAEYISALIAYDNGGDNTVKKINTIDYSDVIRYNNWMKNSE
ncbi:MAG: hypothetical protein IJ703_08575 [Eubacterium sp.]|nr:hypothetical protein [Eubacterium sp.]